MKLITFFFLCVSLGYIQCDKILLVFPVAARSHYHLGSALARGLAEKGHDVTIISAFEEKNPPKNGSYRDIKLTGILEAMDEKRKSFNMFDMADGNPYISLLFMAKMTAEMGEEALSHPSVQKLIKSGEKFDAVIVEQFQNDAQRALAKHFGAHLITFNTVGANSWINPLVANPSPLSYIPEMVTSYTSNMSFSERVKNVLLYLYGQLIQRLVVYPTQNQQIKKYISEEIDLYDVLYNSSIVLLNSHPAMNQPIPKVPSMIEIGGFHVKPSGKLPDDLQQYLDNAKEGVVYFSMGSNLKSADLPLEKRDAILKVFSKLKQKVLWKFEDDTLVEKPANIKLGKWLPQQEILAHKNVKLFITHGGLLSTTETIYHGMPVLAIPIFGDQKVNANNAVNNGVGLMLPYKELNEKSLAEKLEELLTNPKYAENAKKRAKIFHDRECKPMDTAVYWIEHVIRNNGASHLRVAGLDLPCYKYLLVDVIAFLAVICSLILYINFLIIRKVYKKFCKGKSKPSKKVKKN